MITSAKGIGVRIEEDEDTGLLIVLQEMPANGRQDDAYDSCITQEGHLNIGNEEHPQGNGQEDQTRAQVRLLQNEQEGNADEQGNREETAPRIELTNTV